MRERLRRARKLRHEFAYWSGRRARGGRLEDGIPFYRWLFCEHFGVGEGFYAGRRILDVGCGPRGSLEWADEAAERVGLDPLAGRYARLQTRPQRCATCRAARSASRSATPISTWSPRSTRSTTSTTSTPRCARSRA